MKNSSTFHPLIEKTRKGIDISYLDKGCVKNKRGDINIRVSPNSLERVLKIMDSVIKKLAEKGIEVVIKEKDYKTATCVTVSEEIFTIDMYEKINIVKKEEKDWLGSNQHLTLPPKTRQFTSRIFIKGNLALSAFARAECL